MTALNMSFCRNRFDDIKNNFDRLLFINEIFYLMNTKLKKNHNPNYIFNTGLPLFESKNLP